MCGFAGVLRTDSQPVAAATIATMSATIAHRGPDGDGIWVDGPIGLGHRRLAIIDLTAGGHQPMTNADLVIVYNGEVYNFHALRAELAAAGHRFQSSSDTEVVLHAFEEWGPACLDRFNGMFAFAVWDKRKRQLFLARDRYGVKPLYYRWNGQSVIFASEIKAILAHPGVHRAVSHPALNQYFTFQNILSDLTLFEGIRILPPGHHLTIDADGTAGPTLRRYWDFPLSPSMAGVSLEEASEEVGRLFAKSVTSQLVSDVPIGCYLSGGLDSGSITAVAASRLGRLTTFTVGFDLSSASGLEMGFDERADAELLSNVLKTEQYEMVMHAGDMAVVMPRLIRHLEDLRVGQCYPNFYVARLAGKFVKVVLSGVGGDELFGGYPWRYFRSSGIATPADYHERYYTAWQRLVPDEDKADFFNEPTLRQLSGHSTFDTLRSVFPSDTPLVTNADFVNACLYFEMKTFLHGLLVVEDKMSMAHGLESRVPFLDNDLVDFACKLPAHYKVAYADDASAFVDEDDLLSKYRPPPGVGVGKIVLRAAMEKVISPTVTNRAKKGFSAPDASWFRGESIEYVNELLRDRQAAIYDYLRHGYICRKLEEHATGTHNHRLFIWSLLSFEWWLREFLR